jgi:hypothetical protein
VFEYDQEDNDDVLKDLYRMTDIDNVGLEQEDTEPIHSKLSKAYLGETSRVEIFRGSDGSERHRLWALTSNHAVGKSIETGRGLLNGSWAESSSRTSKSSDDGELHGGILLLICYSLAKLTYCQSTGVLYHGANKIAISGVQLSIKPDTPQAVLSAGINDT